ncbi:hypothetical protein ACWGTO_32355 [Mesorhizobium sp. PL10]
MIDQLSRARNIRFYALVAQVMQRRYPTYLIAFARSPNAGIECGDGIFDSLLKRHERALCMKRRSQCRAIKDCGHLS